MCAFNVIQFRDFDNFMVIKLCGLNARRTIQPAILKIPLSHLELRVKMFRKLLNFYSLRGQFNAEINVRSYRKKEEKKKNIVEKIQ